MTDLKDFDQILSGVKERIADISELLSVSDGIAKGGVQADRTRVAALKISIDSRLKLMEYWAPKATQTTNLNIQNPVRVVYERLDKDISSEPVGSTA